MAAKNPETFTLTHPQGHFEVTAAGDTRARMLMARGYTLAPGSPSPAPDPNAEPLSPEPAEKAAEPTKAELMAQADELGLDTRGTKAELSERIAEAQAE